MSLSEERARSLQIPTAKASDSDQTPLVQLDVVSDSCLFRLKIERLYLLSGSILN